MTNHVGSKRRSSVDKLSEPLDFGLASSAVGAADRTIQICIAANATVGQLFRTLDYPAATGGDLIRSGRA